MNRPLRVKMTFRDARLHQKAALQIALYRPCPCGSGKKYKFCCYKKERK